MVTPLFIVTDRFGPQRGAEWDRYIRWSGLSQLTEVVSLDDVLCPSVVGAPLPADWAHIVNEDFMLRYFHDLDYLLARVGSIEGRNLLALFRNPEVLPRPPRDGFQFEGFDLVDVQGGISALTNCGGFPLAFSNDELNDHGLLATLERANIVRDHLRRHYPAESHADCDVWAIFRAEKDPREQHARK